MKLLAVTGCPTGVAHTFMAAEALTKAAKDKGITIKVETNGAIGRENELTSKDIKEADFIIVASDKNVDIDRFNGKRVLEVSVGAGMKKADELIQKCIDGNIPVRSGKIITSKAEEGSAADKGKKVGQQIYKHLMNGVSHMLPFVVAGGVLTAISFLWGIYSADPNSEDYNEFAFLLKTVGGFSMNLMVPVLTGYIAQSISGRPGLIAGLCAGMIAFSTGSGFLGGIIGGFLSGYFCLFLVKSLQKLPKQLEAFKSIFLVPIISIAVIGCFMWIIGIPCNNLNEALKDALTKMQDENEILLGIIIGCMCAFDMGGPVNKAAYVTGTVLLQDGNFYFMAGVSAACITPPLIIALAATFAKNRFNTADRTAGLVNYVLAFTHITEGAIPYAAKSPLKVIPIFMLGSSVSAVLTYLLGIQVPAPHGGFLILPLVNNPFLWVACIFIGSIVGAILYVVFTPKVEVEVDAK